MVHTPPGVTEEANSIGTRFSSISNDPELMASPAQQRQLSEILSKLQLRKHHTPVTMTELLSAATSARLSVS
jgi:hypothetical protein